VSIDVERVRAANDIIAVYSEYARKPLRKVGSQFTTACLRHEDRHPSLFLHPGKQVFFCHSCSWGGDVFRFVEDVEGIPFSRALAILATRAGIELERHKPTESERQQAALDRELRQLLADTGFAEQDARELFRKHRDRWRSDPEFRDWLRDDLQFTRGITIAIVNALTSAEVRKERPAA
jgi:DNA primase